MLVDPAPKVLYGSKNKPGIFPSSSIATREAAQEGLNKGWLSPTGQFEGTGRSKKELYRITQAGVQQALDSAEPLVLVKESLTALQRNGKELENLRGAVEESLASFQKKIGESLASLGSQKEMVTRLLDRLKPPDLGALLQALPRPDTSQPSPPADWLNDALHYLADYRRRNPYAHCPLPELFREVAAPRRLTVGQFHDGLRELLGRGQIRLHPFTGAAYQLRDEEYALVAGQEIKYYAEPIGGA
jgi:hypothetical protein